MKVDDKNKPEKADQYKPVALPKAQKFAENSANEDPDLYEMI